MFDVRTCEVNDTACVFVEPACQTISRYLHQNVKFRAAKFIHFDRKATKRDLTWDFDRKATNRDLTWNFDRKAVLNKVRRVRPW